MQLGKVRRRHVALALLGVCAVAGCHASPALERLSDARRLASNLAAQFTRAVDSGNEAVTADTSERETGFAADADAARAEIRRNVEALRPVLRSLRCREEVRLLDEFARQFAAYDALDRRLLRLSRRSTDVRSVASPLTERGRVTTACESSLQALRDALARRDFTGTR